MSAAPPGVLFISTISDDNGNPLLQFQVNYNSTTNLLTGASWTNSSSKQQGVKVMDADGVTVLRQVRVPKGTGTLTAAQLSSAGFTTPADCNGITFDLV